MEDLLDLRSYVSAPLPSSMTPILTRASNAAILPIVYFLYPETGLRCLEEVDYIFYTAGSSHHPWLDVVKIANNQPLWYNKNNEEPFDYEASEWHQRHVRFSDEVKNSNGETTTLRATEPEDNIEKTVSSNSEDDSLPYDAAPSPVISQRSTKERSTSSGHVSRSAGHGG